MPQPAHLVLTLALCSPVAAQNYAYSPTDFFAGVEGSLSTNSVGTSRDGRHMLFDGEMRGRPMFVKETAFRPAWAATVGLTKNRTFGVFAERSWARVTLDVSRCDLTSTPAISTTFSKNPIATPTRVFDRAVSWPRIDKRTSRPAPFTLRFPFRGWWLHDGKKDICLDFDFNGGKRKNGSWSTFEILPYPTSGYATGISSVQSGMQVGVGSWGATGCIDSAFTKGGTLSITTHSYNSQYYTQAWRNKMGIAIGGQYLTGATLTAIGLGGSYTGVPFPGVTCNPLFLDLSKPVAFGVSQADHLGRTLWNLVPVPYAPSYVNTEIWGQTVWRDSSTQRPLLTNAAVSIVPEFAPTKIPERFTLYRRDPAKKMGTGFSIWHSYPQPVIRYTR